VEDSDSEAVEDSEAINCINLHDIYYRCMIYTIVYTMYIPWYIP
jgi:hypothetical protein